MEIQAKFKIGDTVAYMPLSNEKDPLIVEAYIEKIILSKSIDEQKLYLSYEISYYPKCDLARSVLIVPESDLYSSIKELQLDVLKEELKSLERRKKQIQREVDELEKAAKTT